MSVHSFTKQERRIIDFLHHNGRVVCNPFMEGEQWILSSLKSEDRTTRKLLTTPSALEGLQKRELVSLSDKDLELTKTGRSAARRSLTPTPTAFQDQHRQIRSKRILVQDAWENVRINTEESPLTRLRSKLAVDGRPWISDEGFEAGERLRRDFEYSNLRQSVTSNWNLQEGRSPKSGQGKKMELSDNAIDARGRLERALSTLGPDLSGVILDVCCFLKGVEKVERERRWPPRSAKLMLRTGLDLLADHYGTKAGSHRSLGNSV